MSTSQIHEVFEMLKTAFVIIPRRAQIYKVQYITQIFATQSAQSTFIHDTQRKYAINLFRSLDTNDENRDDQMENIMAVYTYVLCR